MQQVKQIPRVVIAGTQSGVGKTTIVAGLLAAYRDKGIKVQSFKVGPDYIDPGFHKIASGRESYNLDTWLVSAEKMLPFFADIVADADLAIIEGVMGLFDGGKDGISSTADIAKRLQAPIVLIIDSKSMAESAAALALGFKTYDPEVDFRGVILNRLGSANHEKMIREAMLRLDIPVLGAIHRDDRMKSPERHLGLTPVTEFDPTSALEAITASIKSYVDLDALLKIASTAPVLKFKEKEIPKAQHRARIGIALDEAFSFYYPASLKALEQAGAELIYFSPLRDENLPKVDGLFFGGGFPEMFLEKLSQNKSLHKQIRDAANNGMPIYAECGGLMYLCESIKYFDGTIYEVCGVVPAHTIMQEKLQRVGYVTATALTNNILLENAEKMRGHEFHFSTMEPIEEENFPWAFELEGGRKRSIYKGGYCSPRGNVLASYLHINFAGNEQATANFVKVCSEYAEKGVL